MRNFLRKMPFPRSWRDGKVEGLEKMVGGLGPLPGRWEGIWETIVEEEGKESV